MSENWDPNLPVSSVSSSSATPQTRKPSDARKASIAKKAEGLRGRRKVRGVGSSVKATTASILKPKSKHWSKQEDEMLLSLVQNYSSNKSALSPGSCSFDELPKSFWKGIGSKFKTRTDRACKMRWRRQIKKMILSAKKDKPIRDANSRRKNVDPASDMKSECTMHEIRKKGDRVIFSKLPRDEVEINRSNVPKRETSVHVQWSPVVLHQQSSKVEQEQKLTISNQSATSSESANAKPDVDVIGDMILSPLDFRFSPDFDFTEAETNALLNLLQISVEDSDTTVDTPNKCNSLHISDSKQEWVKSNDTVHSDPDSIFGPRSMQRSTGLGATSHAGGDSNQSGRVSTSKQDCSGVPLVTKTKDKSIIKQDDEYGTPPKYVEMSPSSRYSSISTLTRNRTGTTKRKRRISNSASLVPKSQSMPPLEASRELDLQFTDTKPYFRLANMECCETPKDDSCVSELAYSTPGMDSNICAYSNYSTAVNSDKNDLFRVLASPFTLSSKGSKASYSEASRKKYFPFATTPHPPQSVLKPFHSEPKRGCHLHSPLRAPWKTERRPNQLFVGNTPLVALEVQKECHSPTHDTLAGMDLNKVLFGYESPHSTA